MSVQDSSLDNIDPFVSIIEKWINNKEKITTNDILTKCLGYSLKHIDLKNKTRVRNIMQNIGYENINGFWTKR